MCVCACACVRVLSDRTLRNEASEFARRICESRAARGIGKGLREAHRLCFRSQLSFVPFCKRDVVIPLSLSFPLRGRNGTLGRCLRACPTALAVLGGPGPPVRTAIVPSQHSALPAAGDLWASLPSPFVNFLCVVRTCGVSTPWACQRPGGEPRGGGLRPPRPSSVRVSVTA